MSDTSERLSPEQIATGIVKRSPQGLDHWLETWFEQSIAVAIERERAAMAVEPPDEAWKTLVMLAGIAASREDHGSAATHIHAITYRYVGLREALAQAQRERDDLQKGKDGLMDARRRLRSDLDKTKSRLDLAEKEQQRLDELLTLNTDAYIAMEEHWTEENNQFSVKLAQAQAALTEARKDGERQQWQPIATAPTDKLLLLWWIPRDGNPYAEACVIGQLSFHEPGKWWNSQRGEYQEIERITHWMPLPASPDDAIKGGK